MMIVHDAEEVTKFTTEDHDILLTTPKSQVKRAKLEAQRAKKEGRGYYFRRFRKLPKKIQLGSRIFYVEDGYVRGFAPVEMIYEGTMKCDVTGNVYCGFNLLMNVITWKWIKPIPYKGFQGFRYFGGHEVEIIGGWLDSMPAV